MSIAYFPEIYPDELIYSVLARFYVRTGYLTYIFCAEDLFVNKRVRPDIEFVNDLKSEITHLLCKVTKKSCHTILFKYYVTAFVYSILAPFSCHKKC